MRKLLPVIMIPAALFMLSAPVYGHHRDGHPNPGNPHGEEADGCDHGATGKPCKEDPQPDKGKDCEVHGKHGGINEDHCLTTTTTPPTTDPPPTTTTTQPPTTTTTQVSDPPTTPTPTDPTPPADPKPTPPTPQSSTPEEVTLQTKTPAPLPAELAMTGVDSSDLALIGAGLATLGIAFLLLRQFPSKKG